MSRKRKRNRAPQSGKKRAAREASGARPRADRFAPTEIPVQFAINMSWSLLADTRSDDACPHCGAEVLGFVEPKEPPWLHVIMSCHGDRFCRSALYDEGVNGRLGERYEETWIVNAHARTIQYADGYIGDDGERVPAKYFPLRDAETPRAHEGMWIERP